MTARHIVALVTLLGALALSASCAGMPPHRSDLTTPSYRLIVSIPDPVVGDTTADIDVTGLDGVPVVADEVRLTPVMIEMGHTAEPRTAAAGDHPGAYHVSAPLFFMNGVWDVEIDVTRGGATETGNVRVVVGNR